MEYSLMTFSLIEEAISKNLDAESLCRLASENGIHMLDILDMEPELYGKEGFSQALEKYNVRCGCVITSMDLYMDPKGVEGKLRAAFDLAKELNASCLMVVPGSNSQEEQEYCKKHSRDDLQQIAIDAYRTAVSIGEEYGIQVGFENTPHEEKPLASPEECAYLLESVPGLGFIFDTGNFKIADNECDELNAYELLKNYIIRVHLKDVVVGDFPYGEKCRNGKRIVPVLTGSGVIPVQLIIEALKRDSFNGVLAVEYAAPDDLHGDEQIPVVGAYKYMIDSMVEGNRLNCPKKEIDGVRIPVSRVFFGTAILPMLAYSHIQKKADYLMDFAFANGINAFDCARGYGEAEESLGNWIRERNNRDKIVILSKCGNISMDGIVCVNRQVIEEELEMSLKTLGTDYIDIYLLHRDDPNTPVSEIIDALNEAQRAGKISIFGVSNWTDERIREANAYAAESGQNGFAVSSPNYGIARQVNDPWGGGCVTISGPENAEVRAWYAENQMPVIAYSSLGRGFFSGAFSSGDWDAARKVLDPIAQKGYLCEDNMQRLKLCEELSAKDGFNVPQTAIRFILGSPMNVFAIASMTAPTQITQNVTAASMPMNKSDFESLDDIK